MRFEWDPAKAKINVRKHSVSFDEVEDVVRIISARAATRQEIKDYEENIHSQIS